MEDSAAGASVMEVGRGATSLKTCFGSRNFGSICFGAIKPWQTTKISADTLLARQYISSERVRDSPRTGRLGRFDGLEQLSEDPHQAVVVLTPEDLGDKVSTFHQKFGGKLQRLQH